MTSLAQSLRDLAELADGLRPAVLKLGRQLRRDTHSLGISPLDAHIIGLVRNRPGIGVSELAELEQMSSPSMSTHVKRLVAAGWLSRDAHAPEADQRRVRLLVSTRGREALDAIRSSRNDWLVEQLALLDAEERAAIAAAIEALGKLSGMRA